MAENIVASPEIDVTQSGWQAKHLHIYVQSGGAAGHVIDMRGIGGLDFTTILLLKTIGRKSGEPRISPLIYGVTGGEVVIVASKGGAPAHPAWYLNIEGGNEVSFQIATQAFRATWREPAGEERSDVWDFMEKLYPPYGEYQGKTDREIPIVMMKAVATIPVFTE